MKKKVIHKVNLQKHKLFGKLSILQFMLIIGLGAFVSFIILRLF